MTERPTPKLVKGYLPTIAKKNIGEVKKERAIQTKEKEPIEKLKREREEDAKSKKDEKKPEKLKISSFPKKNEAVANGKDLRISTKQAVAICNFIRNKEIDNAIKDLEKASKMKIAIPMKGEIPHRKGKIMSGRYPLKAVGEFIRLLKSLKANAIANELEIEKFKIFAMANKASAPNKRFGQRKMKRSHVIVKLLQKELKRDSVKDKLEVKR